MSRLRTWFRTFFRRRVGKDEVARPLPRTWRVRRKYHLLLAAAVVAIAMVPLNHEWAVGFSGFFALLGAAVSAFVERRGSRDGVLQVLRDRIETYEPAKTQSYREAPDKGGITVDGERIAREEIREVVLGHYTRIEGKVRVHYWPVYLVLRGRVVEVALHRREESAKEMTAKIASILEVPKRDVDTGDFLRPVEDSALAMVGAAAQGALAIGVGLTAALVGLRAGEPLISMLMFGSIPFGLFFINERVERAMGRRTRDATDQLVTDAFEVGAVRVRVDAASDEEDVELAEHGAQPEDEKSMTR